MSAGRNRLRYPRAMGVGGFLITASLTYSNPDALWPATISALLGVIAAWWQRWGAPAYSGADACSVVFDRNSVFWILTSRI